MSVEIRLVQPTLKTLQTYAGVSIAYGVESRFRVEPFDPATGGFNFVLETVPEPYLHDADKDEGEHPTDWLKLGDISEWEVFTAFDGDRSVGGAVLALDTPGLSFLEGNREIAALWDIRVAPDLRAYGVGKALFGIVVAAARTRGCKLLKIETQNTNVAACRFYAAMGCELGAVNRFAYKEPYADEVQMVWYLGLG